MKIFVNQIEQELAHVMHLKELLHLLSPKQPYAISVNEVFIPKTKYQDVALNEFDQIEIISPVTGG